MAKEPDWAGAHHRNAMRQMSERQAAASQLIAGATRLRLEFYGASNVLRLASLRHSWPELYDAINDTCLAIEGFQ